MQEMTITTSDGITRTIEGKQFGNEFRVYRVHGDITSHDSLADMAQDVACTLGVERVTIKI